MEYIQGDILTLDGFKQGYLGFEHDTVVEQGKGNPPKKSLAKGLIVPGLVNAHTHIGDSFIKKKNVAFPKTIAQLVAPPDGIKHQLLQSASNQEIIEGMKESIQLMRNTGTEYFFDFREQGTRGVTLLKNALQTKGIGAIVFSRPQKYVYDSEELKWLLENSNGIGVSSISDWEYAELEKIAHETKRKKKLFALHGSEAVREDIDQILALQPNFLVHMVKATKADLLRVKEENIPIVICPRSNAFFGLKPNIHRMKQCGITLMLGTDNAMIQSPNILEELIYLKQRTKEFSLEDLFHMITYTPRKVLNEDAGIQVANHSSPLIVLERETLKPIYISRNKRGMS